jgi:hypothetical protein
MALDVLKNRNPGAGGMAQGIEGLPTTKQALITNPRTKKKKKKKKKQRKETQAGHVFNPSYLGDTDQEVYSSKPALGKYFKRPNLKNTHHKKGLVEWIKQ